MKIDYDIFQKLLDSLQKTTKDSTIDITFSGEEIAFMINLFNSLHRIQAEISHGMMSTRAVAGMEDRYDLK